MCHLLLLAPLLSLPLFLIWPLSIAAPVYGVIVAFSILIYAMLIKTMRQPVRTGREELLHAKGTVLRAAGPGTFWVRVHGEEWQARSTEPGLAQGDRICVVGLDGMTLQILREAPARTGQHTPDIES
jgi:membrane-bound serine protease (ClpP class)